MRAIRILVSSIVLRDVLNLPEGAEIIHAGVYERQAGVITLTVAHPDLPEVPEGMMPADASPSFQQDNVHKVPAVRMLDWGIHR